jgi:hypothetical protein
MVFDHLGPGEEAGARVRAAQRIARRIESARRQHAPVEHDRGAAVGRITAAQPPSTPVIQGFVTPSASEVASVASMALPPPRMTSAPAAAARRLCAATRPLRLVTGGLSTRIDGPP